MSSTSPKPKPFLIDPPVPHYHPTTDDWYPSFDVDTSKWGKVSDEDHDDLFRGGRVRVSFFPATAKHLARVSVWGSDDTGMEKNFEYEEDARRFVCHLPAFICRDWLWSVGFRWA